MDKVGKVASTQGHLDIEDIRDDVVLLKNGSASALLQTTAVNFDLLSEDEQDAMIFAFAALLNSLTFPIQILIRTKRMDISNYLAKVLEAGAATHNPNLAAQIEKYSYFIQELVSRNQVLDKRFYVAIPYIGIDLSQVTSNITGLFKKRAPVVDKGDLLERARANLEPKVEHLTKQFSRIGVKTVRLNTEELVELFYDLYNPDVAREQKAALEPAEYSTPIVEPSLAPSYEKPAEEITRQETAGKKFEPTEPVALAGSTELPHQYQEAAGPQSDLTGVGTDAEASGQAESSGGQNEIA